MVATHFPPDFRSFLAAVPLTVGMNEVEDLIIYVNGEDFIDQWLADNARLCNCANCHAVIVSKDERLRILKAVGGNSDKIPPAMGGRINGRPHCEQCLASHQPPGGYGDNLTPRQAAKLGKTN